MTEPPKVTRCMRGIQVVLIGCAVAVVGEVALMLHNSRRMLDERDLGSLIGTGMLVFIDVLFLFMLWQFIQTLRTAIREWPTAPSSEMTTGNLRGGLCEAFTKPTKDLNPAYRWGMLAFVLLLLAWNLKWLLNLRPAYSGERYTNLVVVLMLLLNHLAWSFQFPRPMTVALRVQACGWLVLGGAYVFSVVVD